MMEKTKTALLAGLVILSLMQSYLLAYSMPGLGATISPPQDYVKTEPMGQEEQVEDLIFPEDIVVHLGKEKHTVFYPSMNFYNLIYSKIQSREFKGFQHNTVSVMNWQDVRDRDPGVELRFGEGVPVELLSKVLKLEGNMQFLEDVIDRIWIFKSSDSEEVRTYFFSANGTTVYESLKADLTAQDVEMYVGYGEYQTAYKPTEDELYIPQSPLESQRSVVDYETYSPEQMQRNLFDDPGVTRAISDRSGSQIYTDGKRGLQVEQDGKWISYTDPVAGQGEDDSESENVYESIKFINQHGGWDGLYRYMHSALSSAQTVKYQQYYSTPFYGSYPIVPNEPFMFGEIRLRLQQGAVSEYARSVLTLQKKSESQDIEWLPGGEMLKTVLADYPRRSEVEALFPAMLATPQDDAKLSLEPVWAVRLTDGTQQVLLQAMSRKPQPGEPGGATADAATTGVAGGSKGGGAAADAATTGAADEPKDDGTTADAGATDAADGPKDGGTTADAGATGAADESQAGSATADAGATEAADEPKDDGTAGAPAEPQAGKAASSGTGGSGNADMAAESGDPAGDDNGGKPDDGDSADGDAGSGGTKAEDAASPEDGPFGEENRGPIVNRILLAP